MRVVISLVVLTSVSAFGQHVRGFVVEQGTRRPIEDAVVSLRPSGVYNGPNLDTAATDVHGAFELSTDKLGSFVVQAKKEGYPATLPGLSEVVNARAVVLDEAHKTAEVQLELSLPGKFSGLVIDEDTAQPVPQLHLLGLQTWYMRGERVLLPGRADVITDAQGRFVSGGIPAGGYIYEVMPVRVMEKRLLTAFTPADVERTDMGYRSVLWPGGGRDIGSVTTVFVVPGTTQNLGSIRLKKERLYRLHLTLNGTGCKQDGKADGLLVGPVTPAMRGLGQISCGSEALITHLSPGTYELRIRAAGMTLDEAVSADVGFTVVDHNVRQVVSLARNPDIAGRLVLADGSVRIDFEHMRVAIGDHVGRVGADGAFRLVNVVRSERTPVVDGLPATHYVKEIRRSPLEIILDDKPASVAGRVTRRGVSVDQAVVAFLQAPFSTTSVPYRFVTGTTDEGGRFQVGGIAPGQYLLIAVPYAMRRALDDPLVLEGLLGRATPLELGPRGFGNVALELLVP